MKVRVIAAIALLIAVIAASCQNENEIEFRRYYTNGAKVYQQKCQNCHGAKGEGLSNLMPPLTDSVFLTKNKAQLACFVNHGIVNKILTINGKTFVGSMPANDMPPVDIAEALTYVTNSFGNKMGTITTDQVVADLAKCK